METFIEYVNGIKSNETVITFRVHSTSQTIVAHKRNILVVPALQKYHRYECRTEGEIAVLYDREAYRNKYRWTKKDGGAKQ